MIWKIWNDLEDFSAQPTVGVCLTAQKFCKSEQIEQINNDEKNIWKIWKDLYDFSAKPTGRSVPHGTEILQIGTNRTNK